MTIPVRLLDTGVRDARHQIALDSALIELHKAGQSPDTIRFLGFPPTVLLGRHQAVALEIDLAYCRANGVALVRRITGGGAIYLDERQVSWELLISRSHWPGASLSDLTRTVCEAVAGGLSRTFDIDARHADRSNIAVAGKKLCGIVGYCDGHTFVCQGTVLVDADPAAIPACLRRPGSSQGNSRLTTLKALLGGAVPPLSAVYRAVLLGLMERLFLDPSPGALSAVETGLARMMLDAEIASERFIFEIDDPRGPGVGQSLRNTPGGSVAAFVTCAGPEHDRRIAAVRIAGDFLVLPTRYIFDIEKALAGAPAGEAGAIVEALLAAAPPEMLTLPGDALRDAIAEAATETSCQ